MPPPTRISMLPSPSLSETESQARTENSGRLPAAGAQSSLLPDSTAPGIALSCGAEHEANPATDDWWDARRPAVVPFLPWPSEQPQDCTAPQLVFCTARPEALKPAKPGPHKPEPSRALDRASSGPGLGLEIFQALPGP
ncbi:hypothetical protein B0H14DRAFT_2580638 [Mycena olivaceomarginata]|nr:hypothetical protein B0H14DRAFT_2580638 [Mycena olivaceomarginata]